METVDDDKDAAATRWASRSRQGGYGAILVALAGMVAGMLVMVQSQVGYVSLHAPKDGEKDTVAATPPTPRA